MDSAFMLVNVEQFMVLYHKTRKDVKDNNLGFKPS